LLADGKAKSCAVLVLGLILGKLAKVFEKSLNSLFGYTVSVVDDA